MGKKWLRSVGYLAGAAALGAGVSYCTAKILIDAALDRRKPRIMQKAESVFAGRAPEKEILQQAKEASERLAAAEHETVTVTARDGETLVGHWIPVENPQRIILAMHGWRSSWNRDFSMISPFWRENGCSVLYAEQRGQNNSGGAAMGFGLIERFDCLDWIEFLRAREGDTLPIYLAGLSMGATTVLMAAGEELPPAVHGVMADCGFTSPQAIMKHVLNKNLHLSYAPMRRMAEMMFRQKTAVDINEYSTLDAMKTTRLPILFIHGSDDHFVPVWMTFENYRACGSPKTLLIVPGADHGLSYLKEKERYEAAVLDFWKRYDKISP